jgi:hypothetical protein
MPKGPKGQKRPADVIGNAVKVMRRKISAPTTADDLQEARAAHFKLRHYPSGLRLDAPQLRA